MPVDVLRRPLKAAAKKLGGVRTRCAQEEGVLLTFDDGPHADVTPAILDRLKDYEVKAVFFILGRNIEQAPDLLQRILDEGHVIGNHSYRHELAGGVHVIDYYRDLMRCQDAVFACTRYRPALFRPPTGALSIASIGAAMLAGLAPVLWSVDARDWALRSVDGAAQAGRRIAAELGRGDILLLHDDHPFLMPLLDELLPRLREAGLNRTVSGLPRLNQNLFGMCSIKRAAKALFYGAAYFGIPRVRPSVRRRVPHDTAAFTQGLATWGGWLFESTGGHGHSSLRRLRLDTGEVLAMVGVPDDFAEGIAVSDDRLYQLSWTSGRVRVYALPDLAGLGELAHAGEGWGLCAGIDGFYATDGSSWIRVLDSGLREIRRVRVTANGIPIHWLNDLECVGERLLVNVVGRNDLLEVDRLSGKVTRLVDCSELARQAGKMPADWVFNGVTRDPESGSLVVTGKNWPYLFFIDIPR